ncbi:MULTISPECIES: T7SS effector LXG polymorphic toxin [Bacillus]|uniref:T7SS effector LXG polymorphic toxin n=1 Tax=Bacillus TaxID=1386 RepID=UPI00132A7B02|nr:MULTISPECIES: T7SS effector LXG polymorphic toxin [unclassified Bacillus (in: firmicutes)]MDN4636545.1 T7SS effector LXG polymorphic toxin [Bacillus sp. PsM16]MXP80287.1 DNA-binding protein [Bacillus sp. AN2]
MKILDAPSLLSAVEQRSKAYHELQEEMKLVKKALKSVSGLGDEFTGKGADNIKSFYEDLALYTDAYLDFIDMQKAFLDGVKGKLDDESLGGSTFIDEHFLDTQLKQGIQNNKDMVKEQKEALSTIFDDISDLIELHTFSSKEVNEHLDDANNKRKETIEVLHQIDNDLKTEYAKSEAVENHLNTFYAKMMAATGKGKNAQPMYYNAKAFHETDVYKNHDQIDAQVKAYLKVKKDEKEKRRIKELKEKLNDPSCLSEAKYFEIVDEIGYENLTYDQKMYYSQLLQIKAQEEASEVFVDSVKGAAVGLYDVAKDTVVGIYDLVTDPGGAVESVVTAVSHPIETSKAIGKSISDSFQKEVINGDAYSRSHWFAYATGSLAEIVFGSKGAGAITKTGTTAAKTTVKKGLEQGAKSIGNVTIPNLLPYSPKFQLSGGGKLPYNVFDGENLKNKLISMAKRLDNNSGYGISQTGRRLPAPKSPPTVVSYGEHYVRWKRKKVLKPNVVYSTKQGYTYTTDHYGRIVKVEASDLKYGEMKRNQYAQSNSGKPDRLLDDDGGHLIATIFKGSGDIDNLVPMNSQINRSGGKWYEMEQKWRKALASDPPKRVEVIIEPKYLNDSIRPSEFGVFYSIEGKDKYLIIENKIGG